MRMLLCVMVMMLGGCASAPTADEMASADYGGPISQEDAKAKALALLKTTLKDPTSAEIDWGYVSTGWVRTAPLEGGRLMWGYILDAKVNSKNGFGGYTGYSPMKFLFRDGELQAAWAEKDLGSGSKYMGRIK